MARQRIFYTLLPRGFNPDTGYHKLSVFVTPRLEPDATTLRARGGSAGTLSDFPDWVDWPETVRDRLNLTLKTSVDGEEYEPEVTVTSPTPSSEAWSDLYTASSPLEDFPGPLPEPFGDRYFVSYPDKALGDYLLNTLLTLADNPDEPTAEAARDVYDAINFYDPERDDLDVDEQLAEIIGQLSERGTVRPQPGRPDLDLVQTLLLNEPSLENLRAACEAARAGRSTQARILGDPPTLPDDPVEPPKPDFHQAAAAAGGHPYLLRLFGLVLDWEFTPPPEFLGTQPKEGLFWVDIDLSSQLPPGEIVKTPILYTRCLVSANSFEAAPRRLEPEISRGLLRLTDTKYDQPKYSLTQIDSQGAALRTVHYVAQVAKALGPAYRSPLDRPTKPPPPLRSVGISVSQYCRAESVRQSYDRQVDLNRRMMAEGTPQQPPSPVTLSREDITRGYAFDVFDSQSGLWYSLCRRIARARYGDAADDQSPDPLPGDITWEDEGWVSGAVSKGFSRRDVVRRVTETFASWASGWSMVTQRPGKSVSDLEVAVDAVQEVGDFKLAVRYAAKPGSLPPQRFGRTYRVRARAVDLAGNVITSDEATALNSPHVLETPYQRYEPVPPPTILMRKELTEAESPDLVVIRSNFGTATAATEPSDRHIFPASLDQFRAECHGMFDDGNGISPDAYAEIAGRESGAYDARDSSGNFIHPDAEEDPKNYEAPFFDVDTPQFVVEGGSLARMPSLADPMSGGFAFVGLPGTTAGSVRVYDLYRDGATWPDIKPIRLRVFESASFVPPALVGDELQVGLPKGESRVVKLSSSLVASRANHMGLYTGLSASRRPEIIQGLNWAVTPSRNLRLVHAVRQPLRPTEFTNNLTYSRGVGFTYVTIKDNMATSRKSTERVEMYSSWVEKVDFLPAGVTELRNPELWEPERENPVDQKVFEKPITVDGADGSLPIEEKQEFHHTRHIPQVDYRSVATTRYKEYFTERAEVNLTESSPTAVLPTAYTGSAAPTSQGVVPDSERVTSLDGTKAFERSKDGEGGFYTMDYVGGTITRFDVSGRENMPEDVLVTYIKGEVTREDSAPFQLRILSSRRPDPPKVLYAVPTFKRETEEGNSFNRASRDPSGLRIFLDRPWWSSGDGELLGVVLPEASFSPSTRNLVSRRGKDTIWGGVSVRELTYGIDYPAGVRFDGGLIVPGAPNGRTVQVAGHRVKPDTGRLRWYCDVDISPGDAYTPFIRLALARYQPDSLPGQQLSSVVLLDFMQLYPDRTASFVRESADTVSVYVSGRTYTGGRFRRSSLAGAQVPRGSVIEAQVEQRRPGMEEGSDAFGWEPVPGTAPVDLEFRVDPEGGATSWNGNVSIPSTGGPKRITLREYEQFGPKVNNAFQRRLVYAEAMPVPLVGGGGEDL